MFRGIKIFADGARLPEMLAARANGLVDGFTTNPTLMRQAGVNNYRAFATEVLAAITDLPVSFEVLSDDPAEMARQARIIASWGPNVYVKIPVMTTDGASTSAVVRTLAEEGVQVNVTAVFTEAQVSEVVANLCKETPAIVSIFAGRIANTGVDPVPLIRRAVEITRSHPRCEILWASPREALNLVQAADAGCRIITMTPDLIAVVAKFGFDLTEYSRETVEMFVRDAGASGWSL